MNVQAAINSTLNVASPDQVSVVLRAHAQKMREDAADLQAAWQDDKAGAVWNAIALILDSAATSCDKAVERYFK